MTYHINLFDTKASRSVAQLLEEGSARRAPGAIHTDELLRQLQLHQIELERQNEALREAQIELEAERARYVALFDLAPVGYCTLSESGTILQANLGAASLLGVPRQSLLSRALSAYMETLDSDVFYLLSRRLFASGGSETCELTMHKQPGASFDAQLTCATTRNATGETVLLVILSDITARKQALALRIKQQAAEAASQAKTRFFVAASHDLHQPTHAMGMFLARLAQLPHDPTARHLVGCMDASVRTLQDMLENLFDVSRIDAGAVPVHLQSFPVAQVFAQLEDNFLTEAQDKGLRLRIRPTPVDLQSDAGLLHRVLFSLVSNAVHYTEQGTVLVACRPTSAGTHARIEVWDSGPGIHEAHHEKIFEELYQVGNLERDRAKGLGLGLSVVAHTCQLLKLPLSMRSQPGCGTRFSVRVPLAPNPSGQALVTHPPQAQAGQLNGLRLLVIEDDPLGRDALGALLTHWGCEVMAADGGVAACDLLRAGPSPHIILSGCRLRHGEHGIDAVRLVRAAAGREIAACLISGDTDQPLMQQAQQAGLVMLHKPVRPAKLRSLLRHLRASLV